MEIFLMTREVQQTEQISQLVKLLNLSSFVMRLVLGDLKTFDLLKL